MDGNWTTIACIQMMRKELTKTFMLIKKNNKHFQGLSRSELLPVSILVGLSSNKNKGKTQITCSSFIYLYPSQQDIKHF